jgi:UDP-N-acetylglucosamine--N-acetylmuramyl-(pentapeptide) pyrophosphoryl-undecaprenol N-acetylglucosamine transferase
MPQLNGVLAVCAGGTSGHIVPALAVCEALEDLGFRGKVRWFHTLRGEAKALGAYPTIERIPLALSSPRHPFRFLASLARSTCECYQHFRREPPFAVVATGGYTAVPGVLAARLLGIPVLLIEVNVRPGRATRLLSAFARATYIPAEGAKVRGTVKCVGIPLRRTARTLARNPARTMLSVAEPDFVVTVTGGSQGARAINGAFERALADLASVVGPRLVVFHQTGEADEARLSRVYKDLGVRAEVHAYFADLPERIAASDLVISRSGANTLAEIIGLRTPAIVIPYPYAGLHQLWNAGRYAEAGAVALVEEAEGWEEDFKKEVLRLATSAEARHRLSAACARWDFSSAALNIARDILGLRPQKE